MRFSYPRQKEAPFMCIADFFRTVASGEKDYVAFHVVTMGAAVSDRTAEMFAADKYQDYLLLHGLGVEMAEALAEMWHRRIREELGYADQDPDWSGPTPTTAALTGIGAGPSETQVLTVTATSNSLALIPNPTVTYTSPNATGSLTFAKGRIPTPLGPLEVGWENKGQFQMNLSLPSGMGGRLELPASTKSKRVTINGQACAATRVGDRWHVNELVSGSVRVSVD
jgi:hypothetical protein